MKRWRKAEENVAEAARDPAVVAEQARLERERQSVADQIRQAERPLVADLKARGIGVDTIADLIEHPNIRASEVLIGHLQGPYPAELREIIARTFANKGGRPFWPSLHQAYLAETDVWVKEALAAALAASASAKELDDLVRLVRDARNGTSRFLLVDPIVRYGRPSAEALQRELSNDPVVEEIARRLKRAKPRSTSRPQAAPTVRVQSEAETSIALDTDSLPGVLRHLAERLGLSPTDFAALTELAATANLDEERSLAATAHYEDRTYLVEFRVFMDDYEAVDLFVLGPGFVIERARAAFEEMSHD